MNLRPNSPRIVTPGDSAKQCAPWLAKILSRLGSFGRASLQAFFPTWVFVLFVLLVILPTFLVLSWMDPILGFDAKDVSRDYVLRYDGMWFAIIIGVYVLVWAFLGESPGSQSTEATTEEKTAGAEALRSQISTGILAASFIAVAASVFLSQVQEAEVPVAQAIRVEIHRALAWLFIATAIGLWNLFSIAGRQSYLDVTRAPMYSILSVAQLFAMLFGLLSLVSAWGWFAGL